MNAKKNIALVSVAGALIFWGANYFRGQKPIVSPQKIGRNDRCPCGSGEKFKYCCISKA